VTIHQPSHTIFESFDKLLLLKKGGEIAYHGPIGEHGNKVVNFFSSIRPNLYQLKDPSQNPADHILDIVSGRLEAKKQASGGTKAKDPRKKGKTNLVKAFRKSAEAQIVLRRIEDAKERYVGENARELVRNQTTTRLSLFSMCHHTLENRSAPLALPGHHIGFWRELRLVTNRQLISLWRNPSYSAMRIFWTIFGGVLVSTIFLDLQLDLNGAIFRIAAIFFSVYVAVAPMQAVVVPLMQDRAVFYRYDTKSLKQRHKSLKQPL